VLVGLYELEEPLDKKSICASILIQLTYNAQTRWVKYNLGISMSKIYYWHGAVGSPALIEEHQHTTKKLLQGDYHSSDLEELRGYNIYSYRTSLAGRLLFTSITIAGVSHLLLLEYLPTHDYHKSRFLRSGVLKQYIKKNEGVIQAAVSDDILPVELPVFIPASEKPDFLVQTTEDAGEELIALEYFKDKFIQLSHQQNLAMGVDELSEVSLPPLPLIASGAAGSGKSLLALLLLSSYVNNWVHQVDQSEPAIAPLAIDPILYVCESEALAKKMRSIWMQLPVAQGVPVDLVHFKTYNELFKVDHAETTLVNKQPFYRWFKEYFNQYSRQRKASMKKVKAHSEHELDKDDPLFLQPDMVYQEFRICSAYNESAYLALGQRQCNFSSAEQKNWIYRAYVEYNAYLTNEMLMDAGFGDLELSRWGLVVVDEAQDLTPKQLDELLKIAKDHSIAYFLDNHQSLRDANSKKTFLLQLLQDKTKRCVRHLELSRTHRCLPNIAEAANEVVALKYALTGGKSDKDEISRIESIRSDGNSGLVFIVDSATLNDSVWVKEPQGTDFAVVTLSEFFDEARALFQNTPLVLTVDQIKGLEYNTIVAYKICADDFFKKIHQKLPDDAPKALSQHRAKPGVGDHEFGPHLNQIYTCFTRAISTLIICQKQNRYNQRLLSRLQRLASAFDTVSIQGKTVSSPEEWKAEVIKQIQEGNLLHAKDIFLKKVINNEAVYHFFEEEQQQKLFAHASECPKTSVSLPTSSGSLAPVFPAPHVISLPQLRGITLASLLADFTAPKLLSYLKSDECNLNAIVHRSHQKPNVSFKKGKKAHQVQKPQTLLEYIFSSEHKTAFFTGCLNEDEKLAQRLVEKFFQPIECLFKTKKMELMTQLVLIKALLVINEAKAMESKPIFDVVVNLLKTPITHPDESLLYWVSKNLDCAELLLKINLKVSVRNIPSASWAIGPSRDSLGLSIETPIDHLLKCPKGILFLQCLMRSDPGYLATVPLDLWRQFTVDLDRLITSLVPQHPTAQTFKINTGVIRLTIALDPLGAEKKGISSVQLIGNVGLHLEKSTKYPPLLDHRLLICMKSGEKQIFQINVSQFDDPGSSVSSLFKLFCDHNLALPEMAFCEYGVKPRYDSPLMAQPNQIEVSLGLIVLHELHRLLYINQDMERAAQRGIQLIHFHPAISFLSDVRKSFESRKHSIPLNSIVLDPCQKQIEEMKVVDNKSRFFCLDLDQVDHLPSRCLLKEDSLNVVLINGALSRERVGGAYNVAKIIQKLCVHVNADLIIITGEQAPILTPRIGEAIGYSTVLKNVKHSVDHRDSHDNYSSLLCLIGKCDVLQMEYVMDASKRRARKESKSNRLTVLDVSLSANPWRICKLFLFKELQSEIIQVDLSWSCVLLNQIADLIRVLQQFPKLKYILLSTQESWADEFIAQLRVVNKYFIIKRNDCTDPDELPVLSIEEARILGIYDALPSVELFKPMTRVDLLESPARAAPASAFFGNATSEVSSSEIARNDAPNTLK
jgi:hypothetical protein